MPMSLARREAIAKERRNQIIYAALDLFDKKGYSKATMEDVAEAAGISKGLIYRHFASKNEILLSFEEIIREREKHILAQPTPTASLRLFARRMLLESEVTGYPTAPMRAMLIGAINGDIAPDAEENYFTNNYGRTFFGPLIMKGQMTGEFRDGNPEELGDIFWHALIGYSVHIIYQQPPLKDRPDIELLLDIVRNK